MLVVVLSKIDHQVYVAIITKKVFRKYIFIDEKSSNACTSGSSIVGGGGVAAVGDAVGHSRSCSSNVGSIAAQYRALIYKQCICYCCCWNGR